MTAGVSLEESVALIAAANRVVQDPASVGGALRTISLRLRGTSVDILEQMGEETDGVIESTSKLQAKIKALSGVDILSSSGDYRNTYEVLKDIAEVYDSMGSMEQASLIELIAGKNRANTLAAILTNFEDLEGAYESAMDAEGSALRENEAYLDSIQGRIDKFTNALQTMWMNFLNDDAVKSIVDAGTELIKFIDTLGLLPTAIGAFSTVALVVSSTKNEFSALGKAISDVMNAFSKQTISELGGALKTNIGSIAGKLGKSLLVGGGLALGTAALSYGIGVAIDAIHAEERAIEKADEALNKYRNDQEELKDQKKTVDELSESYVRLSTGVNTLTNDNMGLTVESYQEYLEVCNDIADMFPELINGYDAQGNAIIDLAGDVGILSNAYKQAQENAASLLLSDDNKDNIWTKLYSNRMDSVGTYKYADDDGYDMFNNITRQDQKEILETILSMPEADLRQFYELDRAGQAEQYDILEKYGLGGDHYRGVWMGLNIPANSLDFDEYRTRLNSDLTEANTVITANMSGMRELLSASLLFNQSYLDLDKNAQGIVQAIIKTMDPNVILRSGAQSADEFISWFGTHIVDQASGNATMYSGLVDVSNDLAKAMLNKDGAADFQIAKAEFMELIPEDWFDENNNIIVDSNSDPVVKYLQQFAKDVQDKTKNFEVRMEISADVDIKNPRPISEVVGEYAGDAKDEIQRAIDDLELGDNATLGDIFGVIGVNLDINNDEKLRADEIRGVYDDYISYLAGNMTSMDGYTTGQREAVAALHHLAQLYSTDVDTVIAAMVELGFAFESLDGIKSFDLASESTNKFVDKFQSDIDAIKDAWESLNKGEMTQSGFLDLAQEFPTLMNGVNFSDDNWMTQARANLEALNNTTANDFIDSLTEMKDAMLSRGEDTSVVDSVLALAEESRDMSQVVEEVQANTMTGLTEAHEKYKSIMEETNEILYNGQRVSDGYYKSLVEYIDDTEALNACFDENNKQIITNADALKELIEQQREADVQNVRLAKSQAQLKYYELVQSLDATVGSLGAYDAEGDAAAAATLEQIRVVKQSINQYRLLEDTLLGTTSAFEDFAKAKESDSKNTYGESYVEMVQTMYDALYKTGQVGSEQFWAAVEATVPDDIYKHLTPGTEQIKAIYDYLNENIAPTLTFDEDSFSIDYTAMEAFIKKAQELGVFSGTDAKSFGISSDFLYGLAEGENALEALADRMGMTTTQVYAMFSEMDKYTTDGSGLSMMLQLDRSTSGQITYATSQLEQLYAQRKLLLEQGANENILGANLSEISKYEAQLSGLQKQATDIVEDYAVVNNALADTSKTVREVLPDEIVSELQLTGDETVEEVLQQLNDYVLTLKEPTVMELEIAKQSIEEELTALAEDISEEEFEANVRLNEDGLYEIKDGVLATDELTRYVELKNTQLFIDDALLNSLSTQEQLLTSINQNVAAIANGEAPPDTNAEQNTDENPSTAPESNDDKTQDSGSTTESSDKTTSMPVMGNDARETVGTQQSQKPEPNQAAAELTLDTGKEISDLLDGITDRQHDLMTLGYRTWDEAQEAEYYALEDIANKALELEDKFLNDEILAENARAQLNELKAQVAEIMTNVGMQGNPTSNPALTPGTPEYTAVQNILGSQDTLNDMLPTDYPYYSEYGGGGAGEYGPAYDPYNSNANVESANITVENSDLQIAGDMNAARDFYEGNSNGARIGIEPNEDELTDNLHESTDALDDLNSATQEATAEAEALYGVYASFEEKLAALEAIEDKTQALSADEALAFSWTLAEGEILTVADAIERLKQEQDALNRTSVYNPEQYKKTELTVKTYSELQEEMSSYNEILAQTQEIVSDDIKVSKEYKDSLKELGITSQELNECFDDSNPLLVSNAKLLNKLVKNAKNNVATNIKLAKSQAQLEYYELYKEMAKLTSGTGEMTDATYDNIQSLYGQMGAVQKTIAQFSMLEAQLLGATSAYEQLEAAQAIDSANDYGGRAEELVNILGNAFNTGELGTQAAQTAIAGLIPDGVIDKAKTLDEQMQQIFDYFTTGQVSKLFTIEFDDEGNISSVEMTKENVEEFTKSLIGNAESGAVFQGTWDEFTLNPAIKTMDDFAEALGVSKEVAFAYLTELEKYDINWLGGDHETLLDQLMGDNFEYQVQKTVQQMAKLQQEKVALMEDGEITDAEQNRINEINRNLEQLNGTMTSHREAAYGAWKSYENTENAIASLDKLNKATKLSEDKFLELGLQEIGLEWNEDTTVQEYYDQLLVKKAELGQPTELLLQLASEKTMSELDTLKSQLEEGTDIDIEANVHFNATSGEFEYTGSTEGWTEENLEKLDRYLELSGDLYDINESLSAGIDAMEGYAQRTADAVESIDQKITGNGTNDTTNTGNHQHGADEQTQDDTNIPTNSEPVTIAATIASYKEIDGGADLSGLSVAGLLAYVESYNEITGGADITGLTPNNLVGIVDAYRELESGADVSDLSPDQITAYVSTYLQENGYDVTHLTPAGITATVDAYREVEAGADTGSLSPTGLLAYVTSYSEATDGADVSGLTPDNIQAIVSAYQELASGADVSHLTPTEIAAYVSRYLEANGVDLTGLTPSNIAATVTAYREIESGALTTSLMPSNIVATVTKYLEGTGVDISSLDPDCITAVVNAYNELSGGADTSQLTPDEVVAYVQRYLEAAEVDTTRLSPSDIVAIVDAYQDSSDGVDMSKLGLHSVTATICNYIEGQNVDLTKLSLQDLEGMVTEYAEALNCDRSKLLQNLVAHIVAYDDTGATMPNVTTGGAPNPDTTNQQDSTTSNIDDHEALVARVADLVHRQDELSEDDLAKLFEIREMLENADYGSVADRDTTQDAAAGDNPASATSTNQAETSETDAATIEPVNVTGEWQTLMSSVQQSNGDLNAALQELGMTYQEMVELYKLWSNVPNESELTGRPWEELIVGALERTTGQDVAWDGLLSRVYEALETGGVHGVYAMPEFDRVFSMDDPGLGGHAFDTTIFRQILESAGYAADEVETLVSAILEYDRVIEAASDPDPLNLQHYNTSTREFVNTLCSLRVSFESIQDGFAIDVPDLVSTLRTRGWTNEAIQAYIQQLSNTEFANFNIQLDGIEEIDAALGATNSTQIENKEFTVTANGASKALQDVKDIDSYEIGDKAYEVKTTYTREYKTIGDTGTVRSSDGGGGRYTMANGTAHAKGTAHKGGSWGAKNTETALVGELGPELV